MAEWQGTMLRHSNCPLADSYVAGAARDEASSAAELAAARKED